MKEAKKLSNEKKKEVCVKRFEEGKSTNELAREYGVCQRTIVRISNRYRERGIESFESKKKGKECIEEKIKRLERENKMLRDIQKVLSELSKKK